MTPPIPTGACAAALASLALTASGAVILLAGPAVAQAAPAAPGFTSVSSQGEFRLDADRDGHLPSAPALESRFDKALQDTNWRSSTGFSVRAHRVGDDYALNGISMTVPGEFESLGGKASDRWTIKGQRGYQPPGGRAGEVTPIELTIDETMIVGRYTPQNGKPRLWVACKQVRDRPAHTRWDGDWLWTERISYRRDAGGAASVTAVVELQNVSADAQVLDFPAFSATVVSPDGRRIAIRQVRDAQNTAVNGRRMLASCEHQTFQIVFPDVPFATQSLEIGFGDRVAATFTAIADVPTAPAPEPTPEPTPEPPPPPQPAPPPPPPPGGLAVPGGAASFQAYGPWQFKVDELSRGPDGHIQAVVTVRNASQQRLPFSISDLDAALIDADGMAVQRLGNLYRASPSGPAAGLVPAGLSYLEPGDQTRGRLLFPDTKDLQPARLRLKEPVRSQTVNTYPMP